jgi:hypothetical protein
MRFRCVSAGTAKRLNLAGATPLENLAAMYETALTHGQYS